MTSAIGWVQDPTVVLACSQKKGSRRAPAARLYQGPLFLAGRRWALSVTPAWRIFILSARYGLVRSDEEIEPYDQRARDPAALADLIRSSRHREQLRTGQVFHVGGAVYAAALAMVFPHVVTIANLLPPGRETRGLGAQRSWLARHEGQLPR
jgi:hypothetical protein